MVEDPESLLTIRQASKLLNVHPDSLRRWEKQGKIASLRIGSRKDRRYYLKDLFAIASPATVTPIQKIQPAAENRDQILHAIRKASWIFFDVGYTLAALFPSRGDIYASVAYDYGYQLDPILINRLFYTVEQEWDNEKILFQPLAKASGELVATFYAHYNAEVLMRAGVPRAQQSEAQTIGRKVYDAVCSDPTLWRTYTHTEPLLVQLTKQGKKMAVVENLDNRTISLLKSWNIDQHFSFILCGGDKSVQLRKPDPHIFTLALKKAGIEAKQAVYIGDHYSNDVVGPRRVGMTPILFDPQRLYPDADCLVTRSFTPLIERLL